MLKFRALNDDSSSSSDDDDGPNRPTKEALEEEANSAYNAALTLISHSEVHEGLQSLEELLDSEYLNDDIENWTPIHRQTQMRLGCLKILSQTYLEILNQPISAEPLIIEALKMEPENVILWIRLGRTYSKLINYRKAYDAFLRGYQCSPNNWTCIESLVTLSYITLDWPQCLYFCALGLEKDPNFIRGMVFRDEILKPHPYMSALEFLIDHQECLNNRGGYDESWKIKYFNEVNILQKREEDHLECITKETQDEKNCVLCCTTRMKSFTFTELGHIVLDFRTEVMRQGSLLRPIDMTPCINESDSEINEEEQEKNNDMIDETSRCSIFRSRSTSDDKENESENPGEDVISQKENADISQKEGEEEVSQSPLDIGETDNNSPKKKSRSNVKWWQKEGEKRRSQRVRGQYLPVTQEKTKSERGFAETIKDLIPQSLMCKDEDSPNKNTEVVTDNPTAHSSSEEKYFGSPIEVNDVKKFIQKYGKTSIGEIITQLTLLLSQQISTHNKWPDQLVHVYLKLCKLYRQRIQEQSEWLEDDEVLESLKEDTVINLSILEFRLDNTPSSNIENLKSDVDFMAKTFYVNTTTLHGLKNDNLLNIRVNWFRVKYGIALANVGLETYKNPLHYLKEIEKLLNEQEEEEEHDNQHHTTIIIKLPTKTDNIISTEEVKKKIRFVQKMESVNQINDLYHDKNYEALIDILSYCITSEDFTGADLVNRYYLGESYFNVGKYPESIEQIVKIINPCLKSKHDHILIKCLHLFEQLCIENSHQNLINLNMKEKKALTNAMIQILISNDNRTSNIPDPLLISPWCILHGILFHLESQEPILYLDGESVPHSIVLLQFAHDYLNRSNKCTTDNGRLLTYTIDQIFPIRNMEEYSSFDETKHCIEQAIFCLYSHPSKKSKLKYLSEHNTNNNNTCITIGNTTTTINQGHAMNWSNCVQLYEYYKPEELPEFDTYESINVDVEGLFQKILSLMPEDLKPTNEDYEKMKLILEGFPIDFNTPVTQNFPPQYVDMYFLLGDHHFKAKEWTKAIEYYTYDLTVTPHRFDSWAAIALAKGEMINRKLNTCENFKTEEVITNANVVVNCFRHALNLDPDNSKIRIEYGSFVYAMHSFCSRLLKQGTEQLTLENFQLVEQKKDEFLKSASKCFEPMVKSTTTTATTELDDEQHDELWIHHYMLGKVMEKQYPHDLDKFLSQYEIAGNRMFEQGAMYPAKISFYNPPELAIEALEIHYRIHASVLSYIQKHDYDSEKEKILSGYVERAAVGPFMKRKQNRGGGETSEQRKRKATEEAKKEQAEIEAIMQDILSKVEIRVAQDKEDDEDASSTTSSQATTLSGSSDDENSTDVDNDSIDIDPPVQNSCAMKSFGLSAFCEKMREKEMQGNKAQLEAEQQQQKLETTVTSLQTSNPIVNDSATESNENNNNNTKEAALSTPTTTVITTSTTTASTTTEIITTTTTKTDSINSPILPTVPPPPTPVEQISMEENKFSKDFENVKYGRLISKCLVAMEECIRRFPQHHKSFFRIAHTYSTFAKDKLLVAKEYFLGNPISDKKKIFGLFGERKVNNFFNGVWRNPVDDVDRPGSFPYHMAKTVQHLIEILDKLNDHQMLAEMGIALAKVPDQDKQYLYNYERQQFSQQALSHCASSARRFFATSTDIKDASISIFETYQKLQKFNYRDNVLAPVLLECYQTYLAAFNQPDCQSTAPLTLDNAFRFFQHMTWAAKTNQAPLSMGRNPMNKNWGAPSSSNNTNNNVESDGLNSSPYFGLAGNMVTNMVGLQKRKKDPLNRQLSRTQSQPGDVENNIPRKKSKTLPHGAPSNLNKNQPRDLSAMTIGMMSYQTAHDAMNQKIMKPFQTQQQLISSSDIIDLSTHEGLDIQRGRPMDYRIPELPTVATTCSDIEIVEQRDPLAITPPKMTPWSSSSSSTSAMRPTSPPLGISQKYFMDSSGWSNSSAKGVGSTVANNNSKPSSNLQISRVKTGSTLNSSTSTIKKPSPAHQQTSSSHYSITNNLSSSATPNTTNASSNRKHQHQPPPQENLSTTPNQSKTTLNTSPYKTQSTILSNPLHEIPTKATQAVNPSQPPPKAHSQSNRRLSDYNNGHGSSSDQPLEIIDLTNKSPPSKKMTSSTTTFPSTTTNITPVDRFPTGNISSSSSGVQISSQKQRQKIQQQHQQKNISIPKSTIPLSASSYPLPPKKKRLMMIPEPVIVPPPPPTEDSNDSDVIVIE